MNIICSHLADSQWSCTVSLCCCPLKRCHHRTVVSLTSRWLPTIGILGPLLICKELYSAITRKADYLDGLGKALLAPVTTHSGQGRLWNASLGLPGAGVVCKGRGWECTLFWEHPLVSLCRPATRTYIYVYTLLCLQTSSMPTTPFDPPPPPNHRLTHTDNLCCPYHSLTPKGRRGAKTWRAKVTGIASAPISCE